MKKKIMIFGSTGSLGKILKKYLSKKYKVFFDKEFKFKLKKTNGHNFLKKILKKKNPDCVINLVALTNVDYCEKNKKKANKSNNFFVKDLVTAITKTNNAHLIHVSTDQVYNGKGKHIETLTKPVNFYGLSKLRGENHAKKIVSTILRTNFVGKTQNKKNICNWIYKNLKKEKNINGYKNIHFSPLHTSTLIKMIDKTIKEKKVGIFNLGSKNKISKDKFAKKFADGVNLNKKLIKSINYSSKALLAKRPLDMSMKVKKFEKVFKIKLPLIENEIRKLVAEYR